MLACGLPCLVLVVAVIVMHELDERKDSLLLDNSLDVPVEVFIDGAKVASLVPAGSREHAAERVHVAPGRRTIVARTAKGDEIERAEVEVAPAATGERYRGLLCIGRRHRYAIATAVYSEKEFDPLPTDGLRLLPLPEPLVPLPPDVDILALDALDRPFLSSEKTYGDAPRRVTHLCRILGDGPEPRLGCSGFFRAK